MISKGRGFSLIELLVVIGILTILMGLTIPALSRTRRQAEAVKCRDQLRQISIAIAAYAGGREASLFPDGRASKPQPFWVELIFGDPYPKVGICPSGGSDSHQERISYQINYWLRGGGIQAAKRFGTAPSRIVLVGESKPGLEELYSSTMEASPTVLSMDVARHGPGLLSNYLWLDLHVSNEVPKSPVGALNPWKPY